MTSLDTAWSSGANGIAFDAEIAARLRQIANADATSIFIGAFLSSQICRDAAISHRYENAAVNDNRVLPVMAVPMTVVPTPVPVVPTPVPVVPTPMPVVPAPVAAVPAPVAVMPAPVMMPVVSPADLFGVQMLNLRL
jgi:hypothetical protein